MTLSSQVSAPHRRIHEDSPFQSALRHFSFLSRFGRATKAKLHTGFMVFQTARMMSVLSSMSDYQLKQIGISRSDIPNYAEVLVAGEQ
ncbi:DUF1127 domain-containing protein [Lentibacter algarum]|uniref:DUF1127 domain-containing protein n=1 Tax=Lentibacter algarum TaxID=576131 RepID=UPI0020911253|nr:DUF1127 domain-containing protein [Lentibacter algarum]